MRRKRNPWQLWPPYLKAIVAFLAPVLTELGEAVISENLTGWTIASASIKGLLTSMVVWAAPNAEV